MIAVTKNNIEIVNLLLSHEKIDINKKVQQYSSFISKYKTSEFTKSEQTALQKAVCCSSHNAINILLSNPYINANIILLKYEICKGDSFYSHNRDEYTVLTSIIRDSYNMVQILLSSEKIDVNVVLNSLQIYKSEMRIYCNREEKSAIKLAFCNNYNTYQLFLNHPKIIINKRYMLHIVREYFKENKIANKYQEENLLHMAVSSGDVNHVKELLNHPNIDVNIIRIRTFIIKSKDDKIIKNDGKTPLQIATDEEISKLLMTKNK